MTSVYDYGDPDIREMVEINHGPTETFREGVVDITCELDGESWPCRAVVGLRAWARASTPLPDGTHLRINGWCHICSGPGDPNIAHVDVRQ